MDSEYILVHTYKVTDASAHDKQMKDFMGAEVFVQLIEYRKLQRVDHTADCVEDASCEQPGKGGSRQSGQKLAKHRQAGPSHCNI